MNIQKLRPTYSQWCAPLVSVAEGQQRCRTKTPLVPKPVATQPEGYGGELWTRYYQTALRDNHPDPEKLATTLLRTREKTLALAEARHATMEITKAPTPQEVAVALQKAKQPLHTVDRCQARTLTNKQCGFKATCGNFCKKHDVKKI
jgi:hypothetical protein